MRGRTSGRGCRLRRTRNPLSQWILHSSFCRRKTQPRATQMRYRAQGHSERSRVYRPVSKPRPVMEYTPRRKETTQRELTLRTWFGGWTRCAAWAWGSCQQPLIASTGFFFQTPTMPISLDGNESYPAQNFSISQLLHAAKRKLQSTTSGGRFVWGL
jgi:hypothetical protein